jgi:hypothetical protein
VTPLQDIGTCIVLSLVIGWHWRQQAVLGKDRDFYRDIVLAALKRTGRDG